MTRYVEGPFSIYALVDPRDKKVNYIGLSNNPQKRYSQHLLPASQGNAKLKWITELKKLGLKPNLIILESGIGLMHVARAREVYWLEIYKKSPLKNAIICGSEQAYLNNAPIHTVLAIGSDVPLWHRFEEGAFDYINNIAKSMGAQLCTRWNKEMTHWEVRILYNHHFYPLGMSTNDFTLFSEDELVNRIKAIIEREAQS